MSYYVVVKDGTVTDCVPNAAAAVKQFLSKNANGLYKVDTLEEIERILAHPKTGRAVKSVVRKPDPVCPSCGADICSLCGECKTSHNEDPVCNCPGTEGNPRQSKCQKIETSPNPPIHQSDVRRFHAAARMIEDDQEEAYFTCSGRFGPDIAGVLLVAKLREQNNPGDQWPPPNDVIAKVNDTLRNMGLLE